MEESGNKLEPIDNRNSTSLLPIESLIHVIRGQQVMIDSDLARLYGVETKYLKRAVKANIKRFPPDFMFELELTEFDSLRCKNCTSNTKPQRGGTRRKPQGESFSLITMLTTEH